MRTIEEIMKSHFVSAVTMLDAEHRVYSARLYLSKFDGTAVFGYDGDGLEHVSISDKRRYFIPDWETMCKVKDIFFEEEETVVQIHPAKSQYVHGVGTGKDKRENILHLWRPVDGDFGRLNDD